ncbi:nadp-dependent l-serine l-allo-threonine dehydrogenase [Diaporthe amygdali]|uniref:nadp-dependent l-serine l-allo-threonine dehydrogenase n=1 Tax=Phomopsis amygdali TaxID=1214568 RepID=UPI0022FE5419|nr:nadp-dependent l-serine l-allo-threonine dehydrogenase [Diaporthe amygdali]KAJ0120216.1 nadp-dependent l-serine l-allo-threonine dehydrogenase [Diaporthe amygdali]
MSLSGKVILITGASMGIGAAIAYQLARKSATLVLLSRSSDKLAKLSSELQAVHGAGPVHYFAVDVGKHSQITEAIKAIVKQLDAPIDILINNAGLALAAPKLFPEQNINDITTMIDTNIYGVLYTSHAVLNEGRMLAAGRGQIINITSVTGLECPPFPGEAVYHTSKAAQEAFTNILRNELKETDIKVLAVRPGVVATNFHEQRVGHDKEMYEEFIEGYEPLVADDVAETVAWVLERPDRVNVKALDVVPTAQRSLTVFDRNWNDRKASRG